jgi:hypothetical protein
MWTRWYHWRKDNRIDSMTEDDVRGEIATGKCYIHGRDKLGRPCIIIRTRHHYPGTATVEQIMKFAVYIIENASRLADESGTG